MAGTSRTLVIAAIVAIAVIVGGVAYWYAGGGGGEGKKILVVGTSPDFPPFEYIAKNGSVVGFDIELIRLVAKKAGYDDIEIRTMDFDALIPALEQGQIDVIAAGMTITEERKQRVDFTIPYWQVDQAILVRADSEFRPKSVEELSGKTVGVQTGTTAADYLNKIVEEKGLNINIKEYSSYVLAVNDLIAGRIDAVMVDTPVAKMFEKQYKDKLVISAVIETGEKYGFAVRKGNTELLDKLNKALEDIMNSPTWDELVQKYFGSEQLPYT
ncbi:basic amino acid ABC transporter substrate-binding protein [Hyperthermus butylicus]|uniref:Glutamine-binding periplasmic protein n=1 Tax=Hyperthermus butylicus (strain DSM 5456 / JCM 9403 / PLM1-5) TaxID=415426 RepID=A2BKN0_HYPBU|nr:basic amino acid ABC transporter substrate-binding protein [Hyperthermus butylicus]ABM80541.1 glutamine-binding periplasmic protein precursor [Hyperthermus butylicus DSM 5456]